MMLLPAGLLLQLPNRPTLPQLKFVSVLVQEACAPEYKLRTMFILLRMSLLRKLIGRATCRLDGRLARKQPGGRSQVRYRCEAEYEPPGPAFTEAGWQHLSFADTLGRRPAGR